MLRVLAHGDVAEAVGDTGEGIGGEEAAEVGGVAGVEALVGVEGEDPPGVEGEGGGEEAIPIFGVVPSGVARAARVFEEDLYQRVAAEDLGGAIGGAVVEGDDGVGEGGGVGEEAGEVGFGVANREEEGEERGR